MEIMSRFSPQVDHVLRLAGWFPGHQVNPKYLEAWNAEHPLFPAARSVLEEFGGLSVDSTMVENTFCIDPSRAFYRVESHDISDYEREFGGKVYPIGLFQYYAASSGGNYLMGSPIFVDEMGRVIYDTYMTFLIGENIDQAITYIVTQGNIGHAQLWPPQSEEHLR